MDNGTASVETAKGQEQLREMLAEAGIDEAVFTAKTETDLSSDFPPIVCATSLLHNPPPRPPELIDGLLYQGEKMILSGGSKSNKTWSSLDMGISVATGTRWWGHQTVQGRVLYINFELQPFSITRRIGTVCDKKGVDLKVGWFDVWNLRGYACGADKFISIALDRIKSATYALIIIDPNYKLLGDRNENEAGDIASLCNLFEKLAVKTGAAIMFAAHFSKGNQAGKLSIDRIGGSGVWARDADSILTITQHEEEDAYVVEATLRNFPHLKPFGVRWQFPLMVPDTELDPAKLRAKGRVAQFNEEHLLDVLPPCGLTHTDWFTAAKNKYGMSETTFKNLKRKLKAQRKVEQIGNLYKPIYEATIVSSTVVNFPLNQLPAPES